MNDFRQQKETQVLPCKDVFFFEVDLVALCDPTISKNAGSEKTNESRLDGGENKNRKEHATLFFLGNLVVRIYFVHNEGAGGVVRKFKKERVFGKRHTNHSNEVTAGRRFRRDARKRIRCTILTIEIIRDAQILVR
jgi:hypothetical protein